LVAQFVYGSKSNVPDYVRRGAATYRVVSDHLGSPRYAVNVADAGDVPYRAEYSSFGKVTGTGLDWMPFGFAGGIYDGETRLVRFGARDFDPLVGRWLSKEPLLFEGDRNFYAYSRNDPTNVTDPTGLESILRGKYDLENHWLKKNSPESLINDLWNWLCPTPTDPPIIACVPLPESPHPDDDPDDDTLKHCQQHAAGAQQACHAMGYSVEYCLRVYLHALSECLARGGRG
jgi:RHS repeat-associated protein